MSWNELYAYWQSKHVDDRPPTRNAIDPMIEIPHLAAHLLLIDRVPDGFRYRLLGSELARASGVDLTGQLVGSSGLGEAIKVQWQSVIETAFRHQKPQLVLLRLMPLVERQVVLIFLPLAGPEGGTEMLLVGAFGDGKVNPPFDIEGLELVEIGM